MSARESRRAAPGFEFVDEQGRPVVVVEPDDPDPFEEEKPTLPRWLDPRTSVGRTVLGCLLVVLTAWALSTREGDGTYLGPPPMAPPPSVAAAPVTAAPEAVGPGTYRDGHLGPLTGPARSAAQLLGRLGHGDGVVAPGTRSCAPGRRSNAAQRRVAAAVQDHLPHYGVITATTGLGDRAQLCTLVLWAEHGTASVAVSVAAPGRASAHRDTRWQALSTRSGTLEWVRRISGEHWTVLVASFGPRRVPDLRALLALAHDPRLSW